MGSVAWGEILVKEDKCDGEDSEAGRREEGREGRGAQGRKHEVGK